MLFIKSDVLLKKVFHLLFLALESSNSTASISYVGSFWKPTLFSKISALFLSHIFLFDSFFVFSSLCSSCMSSFVFCILFFLPHVPPFVSLFLPSVFIWCRVSASIMVDVCLLHLDLQQKLSRQASVTGPYRKLMKAVGKV